MRDTMELRIDIAKSASGCVRAADLALVLQAIEQAICIVTPEVAVPRLAIAHISEDARTLRLTMDAPLLNAEAEQRPLFELVKSQADDRDAACLGASLPRSINALELSSGTAHAVTHNSMSYDNWRGPAPESRRPAAATQPRPAPYASPPVDELLDFDAEEFNREVAEARRADHDPWQT